MSALDDLVSDLADEHADLDRLVSRLDGEAWSLPTPAEGWDVADEISHLAYFDATAALALSDPDGFAAHKAELFSGAAGPSPDVALGRSVGHEALLERWREGRSLLLAAARRSAEDTPSVRVPWYGPDMGLASFVTARLMETWAHGQDVRDATGAPASVSDRLRHVCFIGVSARRYAFAVHDVPDPGTPVKVVARAPGGETWTFGPSEAVEEIRGSALGLALVFTQRRHPADTDVTASGPAAEAWLSIAQAFAGPAGPGRPPGAGMPEAGRDGASTGGAH